MFIFFCVNYCVGYSRLTGLFISVCLQVFGLGNKTYEHFNAMGRLVDKRLEELGATRVYELGEGDDDGKLVKVSLSVNCTF